MGLFGGYVIIFLFAAGTTTAVMPFVLKLSRRRHWLALPGERTVHTVPTPNIGGVAMLCGLAVALIVARQMDRFDRLFIGNSELVGVFVAALIIALVGLRDDIREVSAPGRVAATIVSGLVLVWFGVTMFYFRLPFLGVFQISGDWVPIVTVLWLLVMTQAINLIDGLDGLAAGIVAIGSGAFFIYSWHLSDNGLLGEHRPAHRCHHLRCVYWVLTIQLQPRTHLHGGQRFVSTGVVDVGVYFRSGWTG